MGAPAGRLAWVRSSPALSPGTLTPQSDTSAAGPLSGFRGVACEISPWGGRGEDRRPVISEEWKPRAGERPRRKWVLSHWSLCGSCLHLANLETPQPLSEHDLWLRSSPPHSLATSARATLVLEHASDQSSTGYYVLCTTRTQLDITSSEPPLHRKPLSGSKLARIRR